MIPSETLLELSLVIFTIVITGVGIFVSILASPKVSKVLRIFPEIKSIYLVWIMSPSIPALVTSIFAYLDLTINALHPVMNDVATFFFAFCYPLFILATISVFMLVRQLFKT